MFRDIAVTVFDFRKPVKNFSKSTKILMLAAAFALLLSSITEFLPIYLAPQLFQESGQNSINMQTLLTPFSSIQIFLASLFFSTITKIVLIVGLNYTSASISHEIGQGIMRGILDESYRSSFQKNKDAQLSNVTRKVDSITGGFVAPLFRLFSSAVLLISALVALIVTESYTVLGLISVIIFALMGIWITTKPVMRRINSDVRINLESTLLLANQGISASEEVRLYKLQDYFHQLFAEKDKTLRKAQALGQIIGLLPRQLLELIGIIGFVLGATLIFWLTNIDPLANEMGNTILIAGLAAYKGMPLITQFYSSITVLASNLAITKDLIESLNMSGNLKKDRVFVDEEIRIDASSDLRLCVNQVEFSFSTDKGAIFLPVTFDLETGQRIAIKADSGVGKSTLMRICAGLLQPSAGTCSLLKKGQDQQEDELLELSDFCSFVGQRSFIEDSNIERNVALANIDKPIQPEEIDRALYLACLDDFSSKGHKGVKYEVGLGGSKLSEGQKQRLALARAFYSNRPVYILDEVTSNLDQKTVVKLFTRAKLHFEKKILLVVTHDEWLLNTEFGNNTKVIFKPSSK